MVAGRGADTCRRVAARARRAARLAARSRGRAEDAARGAGAARRRVAAPGACAHALHPGVRLPARARRGPRPRLAPPSTQAPHVGAKRAHAAPRLDPLARGRVPRVRRGRGEARGVRLGRGVAAGLGARRVRGRGHRRALHAAPGAARRPDAPRRDSARRAPDARSAPPGGRRPGRRRPRGEPAGLRGARLSRRGADAARVGGRSLGCRDARVGTPGSLRRRGRRDRRRACAAPGVGDRAETAPRGGPAADRRARRALRHEPAHHRQARRSVRPRPDQPSGQRPDRQHGVRDWPPQRGTNPYRPRGGSRLPESGVALALDSGRRGHHGPCRPERHGDSRRRRPHRPALGPPRRGRARGDPLDALRAPDSGGRSDRRHLGFLDAPRRVHRPPPARARGIRRAGRDRDPQRAALRRERAAGPRDARPLRGGPRGDREPRRGPDDPRDPRGGARRPRRRFVRTLDARPADERARHGGEPGPATADGEGHPDQGGRGDRGPRPA